MLTVLLCAGSLGVGIYLGGLSVRASMDHLVQEGRLAGLDWKRRWKERVFAHGETLDELARVRRRNAVLEAKCGAPPELAPSDLENWT